MNKHRRTAAKRRRRMAKRYRMRENRIRNLERQGYQVIRCEDLPSLGLHS